MTVEAPPRALRRLVEWLLPDAPEVDASLGDLHEAWASRRSRWGLFGASVWYVLQAGTLLLYWFHPRGWQSGLIRGFFRDLRLGLRSAIRQPLSYVTGVATLAPALGAAGMGLVLAWAILFRPLPYPAADRLVVVEHNWRGFGATGISTALYELYGEESRLMPDLGLVNWIPVSVRGPGSEPARLTGAQISASTLQMLGAQPLVGSLFSREDEATGGPPLALLSQAFWASHFGSSPDVVGTRIEIDGTAHTVAGVVSGSLEFPGGSPSVLLPARIPTTASSFLNIEWWFAIGRLAPDAEVDEAQRELDTLLRRAVQEAPDGTTTLSTLDQNDFRPVVTGLKSWENASSSDFVLLLTGTVLLMLALALAGMANLVLGRSERRASDLNLRLMLGGTRPSVFRLLVAENLVLCGTIAVVASLLALVMTDGLVSAPELALPRTQVGWLGPAAAVVAALLSIGLTPVLAGLPMSRAGRIRPGSLGNRVTAWSAGRKILLGIQVAVSVVFLTATYVFLQSAVGVATAPLGFATDDVLTFEVSLEPQSFGDETSVAEFHQRLTTQLESIPGVRATGYADGLPVSTPAWNGAMIEVEGQTDVSENRPTHRWGYVSEDFLDALGVTLHAGRFPTRGEVADGRPVVVVDREFAERYWSSPAESVGSRIRRGPADPWLEIVGVVDRTASLGQRAEASIVYAPRALAFEPMRNVAYVLGSERGPTELREQVLRVAATWGPGAQIANVLTMDQRVSQVRAKETLAFRGIGLSSATSLLVVVASLAGLVLLTVAQARREFGIRKAVGADDRTLRNEIMRQLVKPAAWGLGFGVLAVALGLEVPTSLLAMPSSSTRALLFAGVLVAVVILVVGRLASRRVVQVHPAEALRAD